MIDSNNSLVLGSRHGCNLPDDLKLKKYVRLSPQQLKLIFTKKYSNVPLACCTTSKEFTEK